MQLIQEVQGASPVGIGNQQAVHQSTTTPRQLIGEISDLAEAGFSLAKQATVRKQTQEIPKQAIDQAIGEAIDAERAYENVDYDRRFFDDDRDYQRLKKGVEQNRMTKADAQIRARNIMRDKIQESPFSSDLRSAVSREVGFDVGADPRVEAFFAAPKEVKLTEFETEVANLESAGFGDLAPVMARAKLAEQYEPKEASLTEFEIDVKNQRSAGVPLEVAWARATQRLDSKYRPSAEQMSAAAKELKSLEDLNVPEEQRIKLVTEKYLRSYEAPKTQYQEGVVNLESAGASPKLANYLMQQQTFGKHRVAMEQTELALGNISFGQYATKEIANSLNNVQTGLLADISMANSRNEPVDMVAMKEKFEAGRMLARQNLLKAAADNNVTDYQSVLERFDKDFDRTWQSIETMDPRLVTEQTVKDFNRGAKIWGQQAAPIIMAGREAFGERITSELIDTIMLSNGDPAVFEQLSALNGQMSMAFGVGEEGANAFYIASKSAFTKLGNGVPLSDNEKLAASHLIQETAKKQKNPSVLNKLIEATKSQVPAQSARTLAGASPDKASDNNKKFMRGQYEMLNTVQMDQLLKEIDNTGLIPNDLGLSPERRLTFDPFAPADKQWSIEEMQIVGSRAGEWVRKPYSNMPALVTLNTINKAVSNGWSEEFGLPTAEAFVPSVMNAAETKDGVGSVYVKQQAGRSSPTAPKSFDRNESLTKLGSLTGKNSADLEKIIAKHAQDNNVSEEKVLSSVLKRYEGGGSVQGF